MPVPEPLLLRAAPGLLAEPAPPEIIAPPQYSIAWVILAVLCVLVIVALIVATLKITRAIEKRIAYRRRPDDVEALKAELAKLGIESDGRAGKKALLALRSAVR